MATDQERFWPRVRKTDTCWIWTGKLTQGYGRMSVNGHNEYVHRLSYIWRLGPIPKGMHLDHLCRNTACVRPSHLEPVEPRVNLLRGFGTPAMNARKTHCPKGHEFTPENIYYSGAGSRRCRTCVLAQTKARRLLGQSA